MNEKNVCCPRFDPALWDGKAFEWDNRKFVRGRVRTFFYMPLNFGAVMRWIQEKIKKSGAAIADGM